jgi:hypothetical protein
VKSQSKGAILLNAFSRPEQIKDCLESLFDANSKANHPVVVVYQKGNKESKKVLNDFGDLITHQLEIQGLFSSSLPNINFNRVLGYQFCFDWLGADWVLAVEEDVVISPDTVNFIEQVLKIESDKLFFRGINLGSRISSSKDVSTYSRLRFGLHGQCSVLTRKTWNHFQVARLLKNSIKKPFDSQIENYLRRGYMATPNRSRFVDSGWNGTHAPSDPNHEYFRELGESFVNTSDQMTIYSHDQALHWWGPQKLNEFTLAGLPRELTRSLYHHLINLRRLTLNWVGTKTKNES